jgi:hypothetical protein
VQRLANYAVFAAVILLFPTAVSAQSRAQPTTPWPITVIVHNQEDNKPVAHIKVQFSTASGEVIDTIFTDTDGTVASNRLPPGEYVVLIEAEGFKPHREEVEVLEFPGPRVNINLQPLPVEKPAVPGDVVSARELGLPQAAQEAMQKGREALFQKHDAAGSLPYFKKVVIMAPNFYEAHYFEGVAYLEKGLAKEAEAAFRGAIDMSMNQFPQADFSLAALLSDEGRFADAMPMTRAGLALQPDSWRGDFELARALLGLNHLTEAEEIGVAARKLNPNFARLYLLLANIHLRLHNNEAVLDDVNTYLKLDPSGPYKSQAQELKDKTEQALAHPSLIPLEQR